MTEKKPANANGRESRERIIRCAGRLASLYGWNNVLTKTVCREARVQPSAVNYWFGSREGLYEQVLMRIPEKILSEETFAHIAGHQEPEVILKAFLTHFYELGSEKENWEMKLWIREMFGGTPTRAFLKLVREMAGPRIKIIKLPLATCLQVDPSSKENERALIGLIAPAVILFTTAPEILELNFPHLANDRKKQAALLAQSALESLLKQKPPSVGGP